MRNNRTWANLVPYLLMLPILIFLTSTAMRGNNIAMTYGQFVELLNRKDAQIEQVQLTLSNTVIDVKGIYTDKNGEKGFQVTVPNTEESNNDLMEALENKVKDKNIRIIDAFVAMRSFMVQNADILTRITHLERHQIDTDEKIDMILDKMEESSPKLLPEQIFQTGCVWDAWAFVSDLVRSAKQRIELIDNFVDDRVLSLLMKRGKGVSATIHSRFTKDFLTDLEKHNTQYDEVKFVQLPHKNHDRFLIIDDSVYLLGASVKDMGNGLCAVTKLQVLPEIILGLLKY